ncbi:MAG: type II CRISPR RNA-guided endonuclease Cas9 [Bacteroidales bacterium]|nr:type II CRISPR RNA-guided endonuclease Cas9 [Bacteroidales bacterium]
MKKILGLDLGTNSIGWAVVNADEVSRENETTYLKPTSISAAGSRIIPMSADILGDFDKGNSVSQTAKRTGYRSIRRLHERNLQRRERLLRVLMLMNFLPEHFANQIDRNGKFIGNSEPKLAWSKDETGGFTFLFMDSFNEMLADFAKNQPQLVADGKKVPYDWTVYYLRKKALSQKLTKEELAWVLLQFNQKRGYYQLRGEEEDEQQGKKVEFLAQKVVRVEPTEEKKGDDIWYNVYLENGMIYRRTSRTPLNWEGKIKEFIVTTDLEKDGSPKKDKDGNIKRTFRAPKEDDWTLLKKKTEYDIDNSLKTVGCYIYDTLLQNPNQKIIGKLVRTVERKYYKEELKQILEVQKALIPELQDENLYAACIEELYPYNEAHRNYLAKPDFVNLFINDILFYQRPLKSKKSLIADCPYEEHLYIDKETGKKKASPIKCIAKSNPFFQEFRLWQFVQNLRIYQREMEMDGKLQTDIDVTSDFLRSEDECVVLFDWLNDRPSIKQDTLLNSYFKIKKEKGKDQYPYRWNYVEDKEYPCNETRAEILKGLDKCGINHDFLTGDIEKALWHILYSVEDKIEIGKALKKFAEKNNLPETFVDVFAKIKPFKKDYGSYSEKAIKKLLSLMRMGKYWSSDSIDVNTKDRIEKIISGEYDETIKNRVREKAINLTEFSHFRGLPLWLACYIVYGRHSEAKEIGKWKKPEDIDGYLKQFKQHSLRNPIVEQVVTETLRTVRDIWIQEGQIDEIHLELGREMKNTAEDRAKITLQNTENQQSNLRIKTLLSEFLNPEYKIDNVRPFSPSQQEILKIYEDNALGITYKVIRNRETKTSKIEVNYASDVPDDIIEIVTKLNKREHPTKSEFMRYKLWLEQKYRSPYTGEMIPLAKLFTSAYEIEHIIPQSRYFDDSFSNKVICEAEVNKLKDRLLGLEFIQNHKGEKVQISQGKTVEILSVEAYEKFVKDHYANNRAKMKKLLMDDIPDGFIERQLNDSRYISKLVKGLLSNIVREKLNDGEYEQEAVSKNLISCNGSITDRLKKDWGMNDVWNSIILPRFQRLNDLTGKDCFTTLNAEGHEIPAMPLELQRGFNKKRIDHRHHAMDAIVIACTTRDHVNLLNNEAAHSKHNANRYQLQRKLRRYEKTIIDGKEKEIAREFLKPWDSFEIDAKQTLESIIVSFKQNMRVINKTTNYYQHYDDEGKKVLVKQKKGDSWAIRKSMHKDTVFGEVNLRFVKSVPLNEALKRPKRIVHKEFKKKVLALLDEGRDAKYIKKYVEENKEVWADVDVKKIDVYYFTKETNDRYFATRKPLDTSFDRRKIEGSITDTGIQNILLAHLDSKGGDSELAFSPDGIDEMNRNIVTINRGNYHYPIYKVRYYESSNKKFPVGQTGSKLSKFVEADDGTNMFFVVYETKDKGRFYVTIPFAICSECQKEAQTKWLALLDTRLRDKSKENNMIKYQQLGVPEDAKLLFTLSPNDFVYVPSEKGDVIDKSRVFVVNDFSDSTIYFRPYYIAKAIIAKEVDLRKKYLKKENAIKVIGSFDEKTANFEAKLIKETCVPIKVDRLGNIIEMNGKKL